MRTVGAHVHAASMESSRETIERASDWTSRRVVLRRGGGRCDHQRGGRHGTREELGEGGGDGAALAINGSGAAGAGAAAPSGFGACSRRRRWRNLERPAKSRGRGCCRLCQHGCDCLFARVVDRALCGAENRQPRPLRCAPLVEVPQALLSRLHELHLRRTRERRGRARGARCRHITFPRPRCP